MKLKLLSLSLILGLTLPLTNGALSIEASQDAQAPTSLSSIVEKVKETQAGIIEANLLTYTLRLDTLTERSKEISRISRLFTEHSLAAPPAGYNCILEDLLANPNIDTASEERVTMESLIRYIASSKSNPEQVEKVKGLLDQRKQNDRVARLDTISERTIDLTRFSKINNDLLDQIAQVFATDLVKLRNYQDAETVSRWRLESPLPVEAAATEISTSLPLFADVIREYLDLEKNMKDGEISHLQETINLLTTNCNRLTALLNETKSFTVSEEERPQLDAMIAALEKDIADTNSFIERDQTRLSQFR